MDQSRYQRQSLFPGVGEAGQKRISHAAVVVVGCGATGGALSDLMARAGVGRLRIVDRDFVELTNLQRQVLFDEDDVVTNLPKAEAAARRLRQVNSQIEVEAVVADANAGNILSLLDGATLVLDGTDNFSTRYLLNEACIRLALPWIYCGVVASYGMTATLLPEGAAHKLPGKRPTTACLRCLLGEMPTPGTTATCDTAGILGPAVSLVASIAAAEAIKLITGNGHLNPGLIHLDLWNHTYETFAGPPRQSDCPACGLQQFDFLDARSGATSTSLCGRNAVQVAVAGTAPLDLARLEQQLAGMAGQLRRNPYLLKAEIDGYEFTVFPDNRAIIQGVEDEKLARSLYARYIGT
jgi:molybdopterin-synthase adenylyltransferase